MMLVASMAVYYPSRVYDDCQGVGDDCLHLVLLSGLLRTFLTLCRYSVVEAFLTILSVRNEDISFKVRKKADDSFFLFNLFITELLFKYPTFDVHINTNTYTIRTRT